MKAMTAIDLEMLARRNNFMIIVLITVLTKTCMVENEIIFIVFNFCCKLLI